MRPLAIDLFSGLGGWAEGLVAEGWYVIRFDLEDMCKLLGEPCPDHSSLVIQDVLTIHGAQFKDVRLVVSSSPCQDFSYRAMPWSRAKALHAPFLGMFLFWRQFQIQREACEAAGRHIPMVCENVRGAIPWVGRSRANFGSYHLWGDVPALMPVASKRKNDEFGGGSWFNIGSPGQTVTGMNPDGRKIPGFRFDGSGRSFQTAAVAEGRKRSGDWFRDPTSPTRQGGQTGRKYDMPGDMKPPARVSEEAPADGRKGADAGAVWFDQNTSSLPSASHRRKAASAKIAKIPLTLSSWIGKCYLPRRGVA